MKKILAIVIVLCIYVLPMVASAHSGGTDANGGHYDEDGNYHYHHGQPAHDHYDMDGDGDIDCPYDFENGTKPNTGSASGNGNYSDGYKDGEVSGYNRGYAAGKKDAAKELEKGYNENLIIEKKKLVVEPFLLFVICGLPVVLWFDFYQVNRKIQKSETIAALEMVKHGSDELPTMPSGVYLVAKCFPIKGEQTKEKPFGDYTVYISPRGLKFHIDKKCASVPRAVHLYEAIGDYDPCTKCAKHMMREEKVPDWYAEVKKAVEPK